MAYFGSSTVRVPLGWISTLLPQNLIFGLMAPWKRKTGDSAWKAETGGWWLTCSQRILERFVKRFKHSSGNQPQRYQVPPLRGKKKEIQTWNLVARLDKFRQATGWKVFLSEANWMRDHSRQTMQRTNNRLVKQKHRNFDANDSYNRCHFPYSLITHLHTKSGIALFSSLM